MKVVKSDDSLCKGCLLWKTTPWIQKKIQRILILRSVNCQGDLDVAVDNAVKFYPKCAVSVGEI